MDQEKRWRTGVDEHESSRWEFREVVILGVLVWAVTLIVSWFVLGAIANG